MLFVLYVRRSAKILILNKEGIIEKKFYVSVDALFVYRLIGAALIGKLCPEKRRKKNSCI